MTISALASSPTTTTTLAPASSPTTATTSPALVHVLPAATLAPISASTATAGGGGHSRGKDRGRGGGGRGGTHAPSRKLLRAAKVKNRKVVDPTIVTHLLDSVVIGNDGDNDSQPRIGSAHDEDVEDERDFDSDPNDEDDEGDNGDLVEEAPKPTSGAGAGTVLAHTTLGQSPAEKKRAAFIQFVVSLARPAELGEPIVEEGLTSEAKGVRRKELDACALSENGDPLSVNTMKMYKTYLSIYK
ncbi:hypothetical protein BGZ82_003836, partial [Podila clonocystis]